MPSLDYRRVAMARLTETRLPYDANFYLLRKA